LISDVQFNIDDLLELDAAALKKLSPPSRLELRRSCQLLIERQQDILRRLADRPLHTA
jgi:hypothetical protein